MDSQKYMRLYLAVSQLFLFQASVSKPFPRIHAEFALSSREDNNLLRTSPPIQFTLLTPAEEIWYYYYLLYYLHKSH